MGNLARDAIREARAVQSRLTGGEVMASHIIEQTHFGWQVHTCHPGEPDPEPVRGRIPDLDRMVQSPRGTNRMRLRRLAQRELADHQRDEARRLRKLRDAARTLEATPIDWDSYFTK